MPSIPPRAAPPSRIPLVIGVVIALLGLALLGFGSWLVALGGSIYYVACGLGLLLTGWLLARRQAAALWVYAVVVAATLAWALWEAGLDWWPLAARGDVLFVIGLVLLTPWVTRTLVTRGAVPHGITPQAVPPIGVTIGARLALGGALALFLAVGVASWFHDPHRIDGLLTPPIAATPPAGIAPDGTPADEWHAYGRTGYGQRHTPLGEITPENAARLELAWQYRTGDMRGREGDPVETTFQVTPLKVGNRLFLCTPHQSVIALDATSGAEIWRYDPKIQGQLALQHLTCRGLSYQAPAGSVAALAAAVNWPTAVTSAAAPAASAAPVASASANLPTAGPAATPPTGAALTQPPQVARASSAPSSTTTSTTASTPPLTPPSTIPPIPAASAASTATAAVRAPSTTSAPTLGDSGQAGQPVAAAARKVKPACDAKLFMPTADGRLIALDPDSGAVCGNFGGGKGQIDLWAHMPNLSPGAYYSTSPVVLTRQLIIVGGTVLDNVSTQEQSGVIRAFDITTGALVWNWDSGNPDDTAPLAPGQHYSPNSPNSWSISSVDEALGMVYVPLGNQPPDQWGGNRSASVEKYGSSVVALDLATGRVRWNFQTVHHDLWDYDVPSQPTLVDLTLRGATVPALLQPTKQGEIFMLDRRTGVPLMPVTEVAAPQGAATGDRAAPTQPKSAISFEPPKLEGKDMWGATMFDQLACRIAFHRLRYEGRFTPPSEQGSLIYPGNFGVFNWGGIAVDPQRQLAFTTPDHLAFVSKLIPRPDATALVVQNPGEPKGALPALNENFGAPFAAKMSPFLSPLGIPCQAPPWGYVAGVDLTTGQVVWMRKNGTVRDLSPLPIPFEMGVPNLGGPLLTAGGVAFLSGTLDNYLRAYDVRDGSELWKARLPAGGQATPMSYDGTDGRQYVLVAAGGHGSLGTKAGDYVMAYALPKTAR